MLSLLLLTALALPQDAPPAAEPSAAVAETSQAVLDFLAEAQSQIYDPRDHGLESLAFEVPLPVPVGPESVEVGAVRVTWSDEEPADFVAQMPETLPEALASQLPEALRAQVMAQIEASLPALGEQMLAFSLGDMFSTLLSSHTGELGTHEGMVAVEFTPRPEVAAANPPVTWLFDDDGLPVVSLVEVQQQTMMGMATVKVRTDHVWGDSPVGGLVLERATATRNIQGQEIVETTTFERARRGEILVLSGVTSRQSMIGQESVNELTFRSLTVNGTPLAGTQQGGADGAASETDG